MLVVDRPRDSYMAPDSVPAIMLLLLAADGPCRVTALLPNVTVRLRKSGGCKELRSPPLQRDMVIRIDC